MSCYENGRINKDHIKNAMKWELWSVWAFWYQLGSTHPLISKRLIAMGKLAQEMGQDPFINFDYHKPESYLDDFARQLTISTMPSLGFAVCFTVSMFMLVEQDSVGEVLAA